MNVSLRNMRVLAMSIALAILVGALLIALSGGNPITGFGSMLSGAIGPAGIGATLELALPLMGCALAVAIPLRAGVINLGGEGQTVIGGLMAVLVPHLLPAVPAPLSIVLGCTVAMLAGLVVGAIPALLEASIGVPLLFSSLLLSYPIVATVSYVVRFPLLDPGTGLGQTRQIPDSFRMPEINGVTVGVLVIAAVGIVVTIVDRSSAFGFESRMTGQSRALTDYMGVRTDRLSVLTMMVGGAIAGLVGALVVMSFPYRLIDGMLITPQYVWTGLLAAMLARAHPLGAIVAGFFFAALQIGGTSMERATFVPRELSTILQAVLILALAAGLAVSARRQQKVT